ncbi:hypothetical protein CIHG_06566 [Coccidioides immitis H538.4]|uniref:Uncharacterized protein n=1 Tax=Coccidioides immitis H538.4 TaxID=396776 RepID=A0A0J8UM78_COCIT|nr:hypothetical protein CIHG_06566 [Coccidioides immitis H538.4]
MLEAPVLSRTQKALLWPQQLLNPTTRHRREDRTEAKRTATFATHQNEIAFPDAEKKKRVTKTHMAGVRDMELSGILATQRAKQLHRFALAARTRPTRLVDGLHLLAKSTPFERRQSTDKLDGEF